MSRREKRLLETGAINPGTPEAAMAPLPVVEPTPLVSPLVQVPPPHPVSPPQPVYTPDPVYAPQPVYTPPPPVSPPQPVYTPDPAYTPQPVYTPPPPVSPPQPVYTPDPVYTPQPVTPVVAAPVSPVPLSRRELRERQLATSEQPITSAPVTLPVAAPPVAMPTAPMPPAGTPTGSLIEVVNNSTQSVPATRQEPLPPVFGGPYSSPQAAVGALDQAPGFTPSRVVGDVAPATSSLILPTTPLVDMTGPLTSTGEVVMTGQIRLPIQLSEQGSLPLTEDRDDDEIRDPYVSGELSAMSKPVKASQAVSGKGDDSDIILVRRARWGAAAIVTAVGASLLAIAAVGMLIMAMMTDAVG